MTKPAVETRQGIIRASMTRYLAGERLRLISFVNDALEREEQPELDSDEANECALSWATGTLPFGNSSEAIPRPIPDQQTRPVPLATQGAEPLDLELW